MQARLSDYRYKDSNFAYAISTGGKKRLNFTVREPSLLDLHSKIALSYGSKENLFENPENISIVLTNAPDVDDRCNAPSMPYACILASLCDAAGLIKKGRKIICLTRMNYKLDFCDPIVDSHTQVALELMSQGAELVTAPEGWDKGEPKCHVIGWENGYSGYYAFANRLMFCPREVYSDMIPIIDADTPKLRKMASHFADDEASQQRKTALRWTKEIFCQLGLELPEMLDLLSYGRIGLQDVETKPYKIPNWRRDLIRPILVHFPEFDNGYEDDVANKIEVCSLIWSRYLESCGVLFQESRESNDFLVRIWKEIGRCMGVESSIKAVLVHGVPVDDVIVSI